LSSPSHKIFMTQMLSFSLLILNTYDDEWYYYLNKYT
jgi:hypothetical protein